MRCLSILVLEAFPFLFLRQDRQAFCHIRILVARTPYAKLLAMPADMPVEPFGTFPLCIKKETEKRGHVYFRHTLFAM